MSKEKKFKLFSCCQAVKGATRSILCDIQRFDYTYIPNTLYEIITEHDGKTISEIKAAYNNEHDEAIDEYLNFVFDNQYGFLTHNPENFPDLDMTWKYPSKISNSIIDVDDSSDHDYASIFSQLEEVGCRAVQMRFYSYKSFEELDAILAHAKDSDIHSLDILICYDESFTAESIKAFFHRHPRLYFLLVHSSPEEELVQDEENTLIYYITAPVNSNVHCGQVSLGTMTTNIELFTEAKNFNSCLNRKLSINVAGDIMNCPSLTQSFGNVKTTTFEEAMEHPNFKKMWGITKDQVDTCKDCEYRFICTDCRAYLENPDDIFSKPLKCGYDPYTSVWSDWSENPLKEKAIEHYKLKEFSLI